MNHMLFGALLPFLLGCILYVRRHGRASLPLLLIIPALMAAVAVWAVIPDLPRLLGMQELYMRLYLDPRCDIFLWHYTIDQVETDHPGYALGVVCMAAALLFAAWRELALEEKH